MLSAFRNQCYQLSKTGVTGFQNPVLPAFKIRCYRLAESGVTNFQNLVLLDFIVGVLATNIFSLLFIYIFLKDIMVFKIKLGGAGRKIRGVGRKIDVTKVGIRPITNVIYLFITTSGS